MITRERRREGDGCNSICVPPVSNRVGELDKPRLGNTAPIPASWRGLHR